MSDDALVIYVGSYTPPSGSGRGISCFLTNRHGELSYLGTTKIESNPTFLTLGRDTRNLYSTQITNGRAAIVSFRMDRKDPSRLEVVATSNVDCAALCYLSCEPSGRGLLFASFTDAQVGRLPLGKDGRPHGDSSLMAHNGRGADPVRQDRPHPHSILASDDERFALASDLGTDEVVVYRLGPDRDLIHHRSAHAAPGSGPRHLCFSADRRFVFASCELDSSVATFAWDGRDGSLEAICSTRTLPDFIHAENRPADTHLHPDGHFLYVSNRGHDSIACFEVDSISGALELQHCTSTRGIEPRTFAIAPDGHLLFVANRSSGSLAAFAIDRNTGALELIGEPVAVPNPAGVVVVSVRALAALETA